MAKIYPPKKAATSKIFPKKETIAFLLDYSKALSVIKAGRISFEFIAN